MTWKDSKSIGDIIDADEWTDMADSIEWVSGNYFGHSSNSDIHFPSSNLRSWLDTVYKASSSQGGVSSWYDLSASTGIEDFNGSVSISGTQSESISVKGYNTISSNAKAGSDFSSNSDLFTASDYYTKSDVNDISGSIITHISDNYYNETEVDDISGAIITHISENYEGTLDGSEYYPSSLGNDNFDALFAFSANIEEFNPTNYITSSNAISRFHPSGYVISGNEYSQAYASAQVAIYDYSTSRMSSNTILANNILFNEIAVGTEYNSLREWWRFGNSPGLISGGRIHSGANIGSTITFNISGGQGLLRPIDNDFAELYSVEWNPSSNIQVTKGNIKYAGVKWNSGTPIAFATDDYANFDFDTNFPIGIVANRSGVACVANVPWKVNDFLTNVMERLDADGWVRRDEHEGGLILGETGTRNITLTAGRLWTRLNEHDITSKDTSADDTFVIFEPKGAGNYTVQTETATQWDNTSYNNNGTLTAHTNNRYGVLWFYLLTNDTLCMVYGDVDATSAASAENATTPSSLPICLEENGILVGRLVYQEGTDTAVEIQSAFDTTFTPAQAADHGNLTGLSDDDHTQYHNDTRGDARYYQQSEVNSISGSIVTHVNNNYAPSSLTKNRYDKYVGHSGNTDVHVTAAEQTNWTAAYDWYTESSSRISDFIASGDEYSSAYASAQRVKDLFDHELYSLSSNLYNKTWIDTFSGNVDIRLDDLESFSSNSHSLFHPSNQGNFDWISSQSISGTISHTESILFNTGIRYPDHQEGLIWWDGSHNTVAVYSDKENVTLQIGQELWIPIKNETGDTLSNGTVIFISGSTGHRSKAWKAHANGRPSSCAVGMVTHDIPDNQNGYATTQGMVHNLNTSSYNSGDLLYLSPDTPGGYTKTRPSNDIYSIPIGFVGFSNDTEGTIYFNSRCGQDVDDIKDARSTFYPSSLGSQNANDITALFNYSSSSYSNSEIDSISGSIITHITNTTYTQSEVDDISGSIVTHVANNYGTVDTANSPVDNDFAKFTDSNTIEGRSYSEVRSDLNVEDGADVTDIDNVTDALGGTTISSNAKTSYTWFTQSSQSISEHIADDTQAHSDYLINNGDDETSGLLTSTGGGFRTTTGGISGGKISGSVIRGIAPMTYNIANIYLSAAQHINLAKFKCPADSKVYVYQAYACNSGQSMIGGLAVEIISGATSKYLTSSATLQQGNPLVCFDGGDTEINFRYSGTNVEGSEYGTAMMQVGVY